MGEEMAATVVSAREATGRTGRGRKRGGSRVGALACADPNFTVSPPPGAGGRGLGGGGDGEGGAGEGGGGGGGECGNGRERRRARAGERCSPSGECSA